MLTLAILLSSAVLLANAQSTCNNVCRDVHSRFSDIEKWEDIGGDDAVNDGAPPCGAVEIMKREIRAFKKGKYASCKDDPCTQDDFNAVTAHLERFAVEHACGNIRCDVTAKGSSQLEGVGVVTTQKVCENAMDGGVQWVKSDGTWGSGSGPAVDTTVKAANLGCCVADCTIIHAPASLASDPFTQNRWWPGRLASQDTESEVLPTNDPNAISKSGSFQHDDGSMCYAIGPASTDDPKIKDFSTPGSFYALTPDGGEPGLYCCTEMYCEGAQGEFGDCRLKGSCSKSPKPGKCADPASDVQCCMDEPWRGDVDFSAESSMALRLGLNTGSEQDVPTNPQRGFRKDGEDLGNGAEGLAVAATAAVGAAAANM